MSIAPTPNEATTRAQLIDTQLAQAGWSKSRRGYVEEFLLAAKEPEGGFERQQFADYALLGSEGRPLAVVEAKSAHERGLGGKVDVAVVLQMIEDDLAWTTAQIGKQERSIRHVAVLDCMKSDLLHQVVAELAH